MKEAYTETDSWAARASDMAPGVAQRAFCLRWHAWYLLWAGRLKEAEEVLRVSEQKMQRAYEKREIAESERTVILGGLSWMRAWCSYEKGDWTKARRQFSDLPEIEDWPWLSQFCLGLLDLHQGKMGSIDTRVSRIQDTFLAFSRRDTSSSEQNEETARCFRNALQGACLLATHHPAEIHPNWTRRRSWVMQAPDSLAAANWPLYAPWGGEPTRVEWIPIPFDVLPRAYAEQGMIDSAIVSYERAVKKPPHFLGPIVPRYYYRLARLYERQGMKEKAIECFAQFLKTWGMADPIYREPADARARLARLKR
jgi:tetratricopeptide (TPR) repeat protein